MPLPLRRTCQTHLLSKHSSLFIPGTTTVLGKRSIVPNQALKSMSSKSPADVQAHIRFLQDYSACDVSDALLKLQKPARGDIPRAGYVADIIPFAPFSPFSGTLRLQPKIIAPASTLKLVEKSSTLQPLPENSQAFIPKSSHWVDLTESGTIVVIEQPPNQTCAAIGGIMATRMKVNKVAGCVVGGRVRDLTELAKSGLPICKDQEVWAKARSTVGTGAESKVHAREVPVTISGVNINPGDIVFCDPLEGVVVIPIELLQKTVDLIPKLVAADDKVKEAVAHGMPVAEAFHKYRG